MCGVAGSYQQSDGKVVVNTMIDRLGHRGPDACGVLEIVDPTTAVCLAHRRLSIIDLTQAADQPLVKDGLTLSYNGELYNYRALREELQRIGGALHDQLRHRGGARGMAGVGTRLPRAVPRACSRSRSTTPRTGSLTLARDPLGIKPLYVVPARRRRGLRLRAQGHRRGARPRAAGRPDRDGRLDAVLLAPAAARGRARRAQAAGRHVDGVPPRRVHAAAASTGTPSEVAARAAAGPAADLRVRRSPVRWPSTSSPTCPVASFLSGGLDSSIVTALARTQRPVHRGLHDRLPRPGPEARGDARRRALRAEDGRAPRHQAARDRDRARHRGPAAADGRHPRRADR